MRVVIYARVSTDDKGQNPETQLLKCRQYCELHNHTVVKELVDEGVSGDTHIFDRPGGRLLEHLKYEGIVVMAVDRYSRQSPSKVLWQLSHLKEQNITFISVTEPIFNMEGSFAEPMRYFLMWFSNYWLEQHKEKVKAGMDRARRKGKRFGRPKVKINIHKFRQMVNEGLSQRQIARALGVSLGFVNMTFKKDMAEKPDLYISLEKDRGCS